MKPSLRPEFRGQPYSVASGDAAITSMSATVKIGEAIRRSLPYIPADAQAIVKSFLNPQTLAVIAATLAAWAASHAFGIGEIVDVILLGIGVATLGFVVFEGAAEFYEFVTEAKDAKNTTDLEKAGRHFARAVTLFGASTLQAMLLRGQVQTAIARGRRPRIYPLPYVGTPPTAGNRLTLLRVSRLPEDSAGMTNAYGEIAIARNQSISEQRATLLHELVHRYFSPRVGPLRQLRAEINLSAYLRSATLRYLEEALAEGYAQLRVYGLANALGAIKFPIQAGYVTVSQLASEGRAIGTLTLGGTLFHVSISSGVYLQ